MGKIPNRHPRVPSFDDDYLDRIAQALGRRAKAIKYHARQFACSREVEADGVERLNVDLETLEDRPTKVRLSVWLDGLIWLGVHQSRASKEVGWAFAYTGRGNVADLEAMEIVSRFEETLDQAYGGTRRPDAPERFERVWKNAALERVP